MGVVRLCRLGLAAVLVLAALCAAGAQAPAQDRPRVEVVPNIPHSSVVTSVALSADGTRVLSGSLDTTVKLWEATTGALLRTFKGHSDGVTSVALSADGTRVLSGSGDRTVKLWGAATGALLRTFEGHSDYVNSVAFSADGARVLSGSGDRTVKLWDAATGALLRTFEGHSGRVVSVALSADGTRVLSGSWDGTVRLWDAATGALLRTFEGHSGRVVSVALSADGTRVLSGSEDKVRLWDAATGALTFERHSNQVTTVALSADGTRVLSGDFDGTVKLWDAATGALLRTFEMHSRHVTSVALSADGTRVLSGTWDVTVKLWDAATGVLLRTFGEHYYGMVEAVALSADGTRVLSGGGKTVKLWDAATGALLRTFKGHSDAVTSVALSADGTRVLSGSRDKTVKLWDTATGALLRTFEGHSDSVFSVAFSPDGTRVLSGSWDATVKLWDAATGALLRTFEGLSGGVRSVAFSADGSRVLSGNEYRTVKLWDAATGALLRTFERHSDQVTSVALSSDGTRVLSGSRDKTVKLWDTATGALLRTFEGHSDSVHSVAFSPDGARVLSGGDKTVKLWDTATGALLRTFEGHSDWVTSVALSRDGRRIVSGSVDSTTSVWDTAIGEPLGILIGGRNGEWLAITPAGFFAASGEVTGMLSVVRGLESYSVMQFYERLYRRDLVEEALKGDPEGKHKDEAFHLNLEKILDSGPAPRIELQEKRTERRGDTVTLAVRIVDTGGGIGPRVRWKINGQTQGRVEPEELKGAQGITLNGFDVTETFRIVPGKDNIVELTAYNGRELLATAPLRITVPKIGAATAEERPRMHVLAIGVDKYLMPDLRLKYAVNDTLKFAKALELVGSTLFAKVETTILKDEEVTESAIAAAFDRIGAAARTGDVFVLYLAGHGKSIKGKYYYYPQTLDFKAGQTLETHGIGESKWEAWLAKVGHVQKSVLFFDTCYGGAATALVRGEGSAVQTAVDQLKHATGQNLIAASRQAAFEGYRGHGVLTYALLEALDKGGGSGGDDSVRVGGLADHVNRRVPRITQELFGEQQWPIRRLSGVDFPLGLRQPVLEAGEAIPRASTHALIRAERVRERPAADAKAGRELARGFQVRVIGEEGGWAAVARDGGRLGYVPQDALLPLQ